MKNYYEILEVSQNASPEVIEKAYKVLVKKYHPDLQPSEKKQDAENKIKTINEAYEILSNKEKKEKYDQQLKMQKIKEEQLKYAQNKKNYQNNGNNNENNENKNNINPIQNPNIKHNNSNSVMPKKVIKKPQSTKSEIYEDFDLQKEYNKAINDAYNKAYSNAYNQAYINTLKSMGYEIKYEKTFKEHLKTFFSTILAIFIFIIVCFILWHIPFVKNYLLDLYNSNEIVKLFVDIINNIISSFITLFFNN